MGAITSLLMSCCDEATTQVGLESLKRGLEGKRIKAKTNPQTEPEVYVTIVEVTKKDAAVIKFSPAKFTLRDLVFRTEVEIIGSKSELAAKAAMKGADVAMGKMAVSGDKKGQVIGGIAKAAGAAISAKDAVKSKLGMGDSSGDSQHIKVEITVDMIKEMGVQEVEVTIKDFHTDMALLEKVMGSEKLRKHMENAMSQKASEVATKISTQKTQQATEAVNRIQDQAKDAVSKIVPGSASK